MKRMRVYIFALCLANCSMASCTTTTESSRMQGTMSMIARQAESDLGWQKDAAVVTPRDLEAGGCAIYLVKHRTRPPAARTYYASLADGTVVSPLQADGAVRILRDCGGKMSPEAWAEVATGFSPGIGPGSIVRNMSEVLPQAQSQLKDEPVHPPAFTAGENGVEFYWSLGPTSSRVYKVQATLTTQGELQIAKTLVAGNSIKGIKGDGGN